jgi:cysteine desulfurase / selenocysteine lyase
MQRIYCDNAATSWPKPPQVVEAMCRYLTENGAAFGRGVYAEALAVSQSVQETRQLLARLIQAEHLENIVFMLNGTDALNLALQGMIQPGYKIVTSLLEHNSVLRPLHSLAQTRGIAIEYVSCNDSGLIDHSHFQRLMQGHPQVVVLNHASNVTGAIQPLQELLPMAQAVGAKIVIDAAQSVGTVPINVQELGIDLLAASGHKALLGPLGTGFLYVRSGLEKILTPLRFGGTGTSSQSLEQPETMPERYEAGNLNVPGIVGLRAALQFLGNDQQVIRKKTEGILLQMLWQELSQLENVKLVGASPTIVPRTSVLAFNIHGYTCHEVATILDTHYRVQVRAGLHCAPRLHEHLQLSQGTVRVSLGIFHTEENIAHIVGAIREIAQT